MFSISTISNVTRLFLAPRGEGQDNTENYKLINAKEKHLRKVLSVQCVQFYSPCECIEYMEKYAHGKIIIRFSSYLGHCANDFQIICKTPML